MNEPESEPSHAATNVSSWAVVEGGFAVLGVSLGGIFGLPILPQIACTWQGFVLGILAAAPLLAAVLLVMLLPLRPIRELGRLTMEVIAPLMRAFSIWELAIISLLAGVGEEILFRGFVQQILLKVPLAPWIAVGLASLLFGLAHPLSVAYVVVAAGIGAYLGWLLLATDNLLVPILAHATYDFAALLYLQYVDRKTLGAQAHGWTKPPVAN